MAEEWREIPGTDYSVSSEGRVISHKFGRDRVMKPHKNADGYRQVALSMQDGRKDAMVHRLVAEAFIGIPPTPAHQINHKDGQKQNNRVANLEWVTHKENMQHSFRVLGNKTGRGERHASAKLTEDQVRDIRSRPVVHGSQIRLAREFGVSKSNIWAIRSGETWRP